MNSNVLGNNNTEILKRLCRDNLGFKWVFVFIEERLHILPDVRVDVSCIKILNLLLHTSLCKETAKKKKKKKKKKKNWDKSIYKTTFCQFVGFLNLLQNKTVHLCYRCAEVFGNECHVNKNIVLVPFHWDPRCVKNSHESEHCFQDVSNDVRWSTKSTNLTKCLRFNTSNSFLCFFYQRFNLWWQRAQFHWPKLHNSIDKIFTGQIKFGYWCNTKNKHLKNSVPAIYLIHISVFMLPFQESLWKEISRLK